MGKVRIKTFDESGVEEEKDKQKLKKEQKKAEKAQQAAASESVEEPEDQDLSVSEISVDSVVARETFNENDKTATEADSVSSVVAGKAFKNKKTVTTEKRERTETQKRTRSKNYQAAVAMVDKNKTYSIKEALDLVEKLKRAKFDETIELHIVTGKTGNLGQVSLPHGSGKATRVAIATDEVIAEVEKGKIEFDILVADPSMMPKLARVAKFLGPRGLMPNPKSGTVTPNTEEAAKKFAAGATNIKTEGKFPLVHISVGKVSFGTEKLEENIKVVLTAIKGSEVKQVVLKSTMSPGIRIQV